MTNVKRNAVRLRNECERLARLAERRMTDPALTDAERHAATEEAKVFWQLSRVHADDVANAEAVRPEKFSAKNTGQQGKTEKRLAFLKRLRIEGEPRKQFAARVFGDTDNNGLFGSEPSALNFINRMKL